MLVFAFRLFLWGQPCVGDVLRPETGCCKSVDVSADCVHDVNSVVTKEFVSFPYHFLDAEVNACGLLLRIVQIRLDSCTLSHSAPSATFVWILLRSATFPRGIVPMLDVWCRGRIVWVFWWATPAPFSDNCHLCIGCRVQR